MPAINSNRYATPSTLADVIGQVVDAFDEMGDATPIMIGKRYLSDFGAGSGPRVLFVPEVRGKVDDPIEMGNPVRVIHSCDVYIRAAEAGGDLERFQATYALMDRVIDCIKTAGTGRVVFGDMSDTSPTAVDAYGADISFGFTYARDVRHDAARWSLAAATDDTTAARPGIPPGRAGTVGSITTTTAPKEGIDP